MGKRKPNSVIVSVAASLFFLLGLPRAGNCQVVQAAWIAAEIGVTIATTEDLDGFFDQNEAQWLEAKDQAKAHLSGLPQNHSRGLELLQQPPVGDMLPLSRDHTCACGVCRHPLVINYNYFSISVTDSDAGQIFRGDDDKGAFTNWNSFMNAFNSPQWADARDVKGVCILCYGYGDAHLDTDPDLHRCGATILKHADEQWSLVTPSKVKASASYTETDTVDQSSDVETDSSTDVKLGLHGKGKGKAATDGDPSASADGTGNVDVDLTAGSKTKDKDNRTFGAKRTSKRDSGYVFFWESRGPTGEIQEPCGCGTPPEPPPPPKKDKPKKEPAGSTTKTEPPPPDAPAAGTGAAGEPPDKAPPGTPPSEPPVKTAGDQPPAKQPTFREPVRPGMADDISPFSATVYVTPKKQFAVPAALRGKDGSLIAIDQVFVQPDGEDPKPLARVGDTFPGTTPTKPAKIFAIVGGTAVAILGLVPHGGSGDSGGPPPPPAPTATGTPTAPVAPETPSAGGRPPVSPEPPRLSVTDPAPPADFPTKAPVMSLTPDEPSRLPVSPTEPGVTTPPETDLTGTTPGTDTTGTAPTSNPAGPTDAGTTDGPGDPSATPSISPSGKNPLVRMAEGQETLIAATGSFTPSDIPAMDATLEFPEAKIRSASEIVFAAEDTAVVRTTGAADQIGDVTLKITDPDGQTQSGAAEAWSAHLDLSSETVKEGQEVAIRIVTAGLDETRLVRYTLELTADAQPVTPGAMGQTYKGETTVGVLRTLVFRTRYPSPGTKPLKLFLEPVTTEARSPGSAMPPAK